MEGKCNGRFGSRSIEVWDNIRVFRCNKKRVWRKKKKNQRR